MTGRIGLGCEIIENTKITNNDFLTTVFGLSCGIVRNLIFSENRIGLHVPNTPQAGVTCKVGLRVITDVIDCRVLYNSFDNVEEGIVFESDLDGGKETIRDFGVRNFVGSFAKIFDPKAALKESDYRSMLETMAERVGRSPEYIEEAWDKRGYPHGSGSKPGEMVAALKEAGCSRFYAQVFVPDEDVSRFDLVMDAYMGR